MVFRELTAEEIDVRVSTISDKGCSILLYKDARCDMNILDESVGSENWQRSHELINGNLFCNVSIKCDGEWVTKQDVGTESNTEKEKGQASDSFKRACFNWGIGRELYTAPFIWISAKDVKIVDGKNGKPTTYDKFVVSEIEITNKKITRLVIKNTSTNKDVFRWERKTPIICPLCKAEIKDVRKDGNIVSAETVYKSCGNMCLPCYQKQKQQ